jgi:hypothetical protein
MMNQLREFSFPVLVLSAWVLVAGYTLSSLGQAHARVQTALMPTVYAPAMEINATVPSSHASLTHKAQKKASRHGPRV